MSSEFLFSLLNPLALMGWILLAFSPLSPRWIDRIAGWAIPGVHCLVYTVLMAVHFADAPGGFQSLPDVQALFTDADVALAGWTHFLAYDLFIGAWIVRDARARMTPHWMILPILPVAFLFGPAGLLAYLIMRFLRGQPAPQAEVA